jgi:hypothetical protein
MGYPGSVARRLVSDLGLTLAPDIRGCVLATPRRRAAAFLVDASVVLLPSLIVALAISWAVMQIREPAALQALTDLITQRASTDAEIIRAYRELLPLVVKYDMPHTPASLVAAYEAGDLETAREILLERDLVIVLNTGPETSSTSGDHPVRIEVQRLMPTGVRSVAFYGVAALYFTLWTRGRRGATLGKRLFGLRVVRVDGAPLGLVASFERFVGYAQVPASLFTAILDFWRDPNRRLPHDRLAGTVVVMRGS